VSRERTAARLGRLLGMLPWVIAHPGTGVGEVCARFGYTRAELARDLAAVFVSGLPGYGPGDLMVAFVDGDEVVVDLAEYFSRPVRLTAREGLALLAAGMALLSTGGAPAALETAVPKLAAALVPDDGTVDVGLPPAPALAAALGEAAARGEVVEITYTSLGKGETTVRQVEPWRVFSTLGNWYFSGRCRRAGGERVFRLDRVRDAAPTGERFTPPPEPPPAVVRYAPGADDPSAVIALGKEAEWVAEYYPVEVLRRERGRLVVRFSAPEAATIGRLLVRLGSRAELLEGEEAAAAAADVRARILRRYGAA
jgi:proteasome accessory factor C